MDTKIFNQISIRIIKEQELIIGPLAWDEARKVSGLNADQGKNEVTLEPEKAKEILNNLVAQYAKLFGRASSEVCKEVTKSLVAELPADQVPESLR